MVRNFFLNGEKNERVKIVKKKGEQFIIIQAVVELKHSSFHWNRPYMESYVIMADKTRELKLVDVKDFENVDYERVYPSKVHIVEYENINIGDIIYNTYKNYKDREIVKQNLAIYAKVINDWDKELEKMIKDIKEVIIEDDDETNDLVEP